MLLASLITPLVKASRIFIVEYVRTETDAGDRIGNYFIFSRSINLDRRESFRDGVIN